MRGTASSERASSAILTVPNVISAVRILFIPLFFWLIVRPGSPMAGLIVFAFVVSTDGPVTVFSDGKRIAELKVAAPPVPPKTAERITELVALRRAERGRS